VNLLLDTHTFIWLKTAPINISDAVLEAYYDLNTHVTLSIASIWEMQLKIQLGKLTLPKPLNMLIDEQCAQDGLEILPIDRQHIFALSSLPFHHKDPFDRLLIVQAKMENLVLASNDAVFKHYDVAVLW
jgi:PIN domain nuclease of toxin-antitoxin system